MSQNAGTILTKVQTRNSKREEFRQLFPDKSNQVTVIKSERDLDSNLLALKQHQHARMAEMARQQEKILAATSNRNVAEQRGKKAEQVLKLKQFTDLEQNQKLLNAKMKALKMERERAGFIASLPPPSKDPLKALLEKYDNDQKSDQSPKRFFKNITKEIDLKRNNARVEAILIQEKENQAKEKRLERIEDFHDKSNERFNKAIKKEKLVNSQKEVMKELEKAYKADRVKQQNRIEVDQQMQLPVTFLRTDQPDFNNRKNAEKAVKQVLMDANVNVLDVDSSFVTTRRRKKKNRSELDSRIFSFPFEEEEIDFDSPVALRKQRTKTVDKNETESYLDKDSAIFSAQSTLNGVNVSLEYTQVQIYPNSTKQIEPEKSVVNTETQTECGQVSEDKTLRSSPPISFFSLPKEISPKEPLLSNYAEQYKKHLMDRAKQETFFQPLTLASPVPSTPSVSSMIGTSISTVRSSTLCSDVSSTPKSTQSGDRNSATSESSSKLSSQIRKVLQKYIEKESLEQNERVLQNGVVFEPIEDYSKLTFKPKMPTKFFSDCISPCTNVCDLIPKAPERHRMFPVVTKPPEDKAKNAVFLSKTKNQPPVSTLHLKPTENLKLAPIIEVTSPNDTLDISPSLKNDTSLSSHTSTSSSKSLSDSKTKHFPQSSGDDLKIPSYIQHKFLTDKMKCGFMDEPIETIDDLRELLSCLPSGMKLEECLRTKPPISYPFWIATETEPHELSTILEVDTPQTSFNYSPESRMILPKASGFFTHLSLGDTNPYLSSNTPESSKITTPRSGTTSSTLMGSTVKSLPSTTSSSLSSYASDGQPKWADLLKLKPFSNTKSWSSISSYSPGSVEALDPVRINSQSTPVKNLNRTEDEYDILSENLTLIGPEVTVSNRGMSTCFPLEKSAMSVMSESLLSFLKHEEEANLNT